MADDVRLRWLAGHLLFVSDHTNRLIQSSWYVVCPKICMIHCLCQLAALWFSQGNRVRCRQSNRALCVLNRQLSVHAPMQAQHPKPIRTGDAIPLTASLFRRLTSDIEHATEAPDDLNGDTVRLVAQSIYPLNPTRSLAGHQSRRPALRSGTTSPSQKQEPAQDHIQPAAERGELQVLRPGSRDSAYSLGGVSRTLSRQHLGSPPARALHSSRSLRASRPISTPSGNARRPREAPSSPTEQVAHDGALLGGLLEYMGRMGTGRKGSGAARSSGGGSKPVTPVTPQRSSSAGASSNKRCATRCLVCLCICG